MAKRPTRQKSSSPENSKKTDSGLDPLEQEIDRKIGDLVPQKAREQIVHRLTTIMVGEYFSGPIAHPRHLREYEEIEPGSANRIITMAEKRNDHNIEMERRATNAEIDERRLGMKCGAGLFGLLIVCALIVALSTKSRWITGAFLGATVIGGVGLFIKGRNQ